MRHFEFWHPRVFETPYYLQLLMLCAQRCLPLKYLAKANYALDHGELGLGSKYSTQMAFAQERFLPTRLLTATRPLAELRKVLGEFAESYGYPLILKPDNGAVGKGIMKLLDEQSACKALSSFKGAYLLQRYTPLPEEYGVFFTRRGDVNQITGINKKHFPTVTGNGRDTIAKLAGAHERYTEHWRLFLKYIDTDHTLADGERSQLSFVGSHTMGCKFTDDSHLLTTELEQAVFAVCDSQPGFNFGRLDVKAADESAFQAGDFCVVEVNGVASLPTHMFDPDNSLGRAYQIFFEHGRYLVEIAHEHRDQPMALKSYREIARLAKLNSAELNEMHAQAMNI